MKTSHVLSETEATFIGNETGLVSNDVRELHLNVLSGELAGKQFTFAFGQKIIIGRHEKAHICLNQNLISRHHTQIDWRKRDPWVVDLNSTNGTFLNGDRIEEEMLKDGDRMQVGNCVIKVSFHSAQDGYESRINRLISNAEDILKKVDAKKKPGKYFSGVLEKIQLTEILQSFALGKKDGILILQGNAGEQGEAFEVGKIYFKQGLVFFSRIGKVTGKKALYRMLTWLEGRFDLRDLEDELAHVLTSSQIRSFAKEFPEDMTQVLLEFFKFQDELALWRDKLPKLTSSLKQNTSKPFPENPGYERVSDIYAAVAKVDRVRELLDEFPLVDSEILRVLGFLLDRGFLKEIPQKSR